MSRSAPPRLVIATTPGVDVDLALVPVNGGTASGMRVQLDQNSAGSGNTVTLLVNGTATALTCTVTAGSKTCVDSTHSVTLAAGDEMQVQVTNNAGAANRQYLVSFRY